MINWKHWITAFGYGLLSATSAFALQTATVVSPNAQIYDYVGGKLKPIMPITKGQVLQVGDAPKGVWYRCAVPGSSPAKVGWVQVRDLSIKPQSRTASNSRRDRDSGPSGKWEIGVFFDGTLPSPSNLQVSAGLLSGLTVGTQFGAQLLKQVNPSLYWGVRIDMLLMSGKVVAAAANAGDLSYSAFALPVKGVAGYNFVAGSSFTLGASGEAGVSPVTSFSASDGSHIYTGSAMAFALDFKIDAEVLLSKTFGILLEAGYQLFIPISHPAIAPGFTLGNDFNSPMAGLGLSYRF